MKKTQIIDTESTETCMIALSASFSLMSFNRAAYQLLGIESKLGEVYPPEKMFDRDSLATADKLFNDVIKKGLTVNTIKLGFVTSDGRQIHCNVKALPMVTNRFSTIGIILSFHAQDSKLFQKSKPPVLKHLPRLGYQEVVDGLPEGVFTIDRDWRISSFNKTAERLTGYAPGDIIGEYCWQVFQSGSCKQHCPLGTIFQSGKLCENLVSTILTQTGFQQKIVFNAGPLKTVDGIVMGAFKTFHLAPPSKEDRDRSLINATFQGMVSNSCAMKTIFSMLQDVAASRASVLISGESGTGKELVARAIHNLSHQSQGNFVAVNCSALPETLLESELFGHEKGAFTGAEHLKTGRFELADNGTLFLDEIGELKPSLQVKLLRVLEQKEFERVGGTSPIKLNARIIAATNQDLEKALGNGLFREDLYYRLRTVPIRIPPLRERIEDIPLLVDYFIKIFNQKYDKTVRVVDPKVLDFFMEYHWPGNVRELERCMEHAFVFVKGPIIFSRYLPEIGEFNTIETVPQIETAPDQNNLLWALDKAGGRRATAAELLSISRTSLWRRMKEAGLI